MKRGFKTMGNETCVHSLEVTMKCLTPWRHISSQVEVLNELQRYSSSYYIPFFQSWDWWRPRSNDAKDAFAVFDLAGVYVLTDADLYQYREERQVSKFGGGRVFLSAASTGPIGPQGTAGAGGGAGGGSGAQPPRVRRFFPETWLWANVTTGATGTATISTKAPDTITEWVTSAFAVSPQSGLGVATQLANVTTFQRFFVRLELPAVAIRGEILLLQCTIFNYMRQGLQVFVKLNKSGAFDFSDNYGHVFNPNGDGLEKSIFVEKDGIKAVIFPIILKKVGNVKIKVAARSRIIADAVERKLKVKAEGIEQSYNIPVLIDLRKGGSLQTDIRINFPPNVIDDSKFIKVTAIGDIMASTLTGLENLVAQSYGCGEQNMLRFAPNAFVGAYLKETNRITADNDAKLKKFLEKGYQIQLTYMRNDGSFSAFGKRDKAGSTWLTAFVVKSFAQASAFTLIDPNVMDRSITYLLNRQLRSGEFKELGIVRHKAMQGGSTSSKKSLTAYVLIALLECRTNKQISTKILGRANKAIDLSVKYLRDGAPASLKNLYELIVVLYALTLAKDRSVGNILAVIEQRAVGDQGVGKYWTIPNTEAQIIKPFRGWWPPNSNSRALDIEVTSYAMLIYNFRDDTLNGFRVLKWLQKQRNGNGGFISTQDTVVALQALAGLAEKLYTSNFKLKVFVGADGWNGKTFNINNKNSLDSQSVDVPNTVRELSVDASGTGLCVLQATVYYNVPIELRQPAFDLKVTVLHDSINGFTLRICFSWIRNGECTMGYLEVHEPTGMKADISSLKTNETRGLFKKIEGDFRKVNLFFDKVTKEEMCVELDIKRRDLVARHKPVPVALSEYYEQSNTEKRLYQSNALSSATIIQVCGQQCVNVKK